MQYVNGKAVLDLLIITVLKSCDTVDTKFFLGTPLLIARLMYRYSKITLRVRQYDHSMANNGVHQGCQVLIEFLLNLRAILFILLTYYISKLLRSRGERQKRWNQQNNSSWWIFSIWNGYMNIDNWCCRYFNNRDACPCGLLVSFGKPFRRWSFHKPYH